MKRAKTPKQRVLALYPKARAKWMPSWSLWSITDCPARSTEGFSPRDAWLRASESLYTS